MSKVFPTQQSDIDNPYYTHEDELPRIQSIYTYIMLFLCFYYRTKFIFKDNDTSCLSGVKKIYLKVLFLINSKLLKNKLF